MQSNSAARAQRNGLRFNVPHAFPDGSTYAIHKREMDPKFEDCLSNGISTPTLPCRHAFAMKWHR